MLVEVEMINYSPDTYIKINICSWSCDDKTMNYVVKWFLSQMMTIFFTTYLFISCPPHFAALFHPCSQSLYGHVYPPHN